MPLNLKQARAQLEQAFEDYRKGDQELFPIFNVNYFLCCQFTAQGVAYHTDSSGKHAAFYRRLLRHHVYVRNYQRLNGRLEAGEVSASEFSAIEYAIRSLIADPTLQGQMLQAIVAPPPKGAPVMTPQLGQLLQQAYAYYLKDGVSDMFPNFGSAFMSDCRFGAQGPFRESGRGIFKNLYHTLAQIYKSERDPIRQAIESLGEDVLVERMLKDHERKSGARTRLPDELKQKTGQVARKLAKQVMDKNGQGISPARPARPVRTLA